MRNGRSINWAVAWSKDSLTRAKFRLYRNGESAWRSYDGLPLTAFVSFLQNHDQIGNRAFGERIVTLADARAVRAAAADLLLAPSPPLLFMGEEFGTQTPFLFFCDFEKDLAGAVTAGRRNEFARFTRFNDPAAREGIPDPNAESTFEASRLDWNELEQPAHQDWLAILSTAIEVAEPAHSSAPFFGCAKSRHDIHAREDLGLTAEWKFPDGAKLTLLANLSGVSLSTASAPSSPILYTSEQFARTIKRGTLPPVVRGMVSGIMKPRSQHSARNLSPAAQSRIYFRAGTAIVPYLSTLGISHCYISPCLKARPGKHAWLRHRGSQLLEPRDRNSGRFRSFCDTLHEHDMGLILDIVPNHMGVMGGDNAWWLDVLENGEASAYACFFDIDWHPLKEELHGKVLVPVLHDHYGAVLESGELKILFARSAASSMLPIAITVFPVNPREYPRILQRARTRWLAKLGEENPDLFEFQSLITAFGHLPSQTGGRAPTASLSAIGTRRFTSAGWPNCARDRRRSLPASCKRSIDQRRSFRPSSFEQLHELIKVQAFRLANWRVASDDINYRRFFDTNDLAGLCMENEDVFKATHRLILNLVAQGKVDGLPHGSPGRPVRSCAIFRTFEAAAIVEAASNAVRKNRAGRQDRRYVVIEKILTGSECLPAEWPVCGTTGYDFANLVNGLFVDPAAVARFDQHLSQFYWRRN